MKNRIRCLLGVLFNVILFGYIIADTIGIIYGVMIVLCIFYIIPVKEREESDYSTQISEKVLGAITKLSLMIMKADEGISDSELYTFRDYMLQNFGSEATAEAIQIMSYLQYEKNTTTNATQTLNNKLNYAEKMQILQFLFQLAAADGEMHTEELSLLEHIAVEMDIQSSDYTYLKNAYNYMYNRRYSDRNRTYSSSPRSNSLDNAYATLGVKNTDSKEVIKTAYRRLAIANHPDKVQHLGETAHTEAEKRFSKINEAYNIVKQEKKL